MFKRWFCKHDNHLLGWIPWKNDYGTQKGVVIKTLCSTCGKLTDHYFKDICQKEDEFTMRVHKAMGWKYNEKE